MPLIQFNVSFDHHL